MRGCETLGWFAALIDEMQQELINYRKKSEHNYKLAEKKQKRINDLDTIYNRLLSIGDIDLCSQLSNEVIAMKTKDPCLKAVIVDIGPVPGYYKRGSLYLPANI